LTDVTHKAGLDLMGIAGGDYDDDGYDNLFVTRSADASCFTTTGVGCINIYFRRWAAETPIRFARPPEHQRRTPTANGWWEAYAASVWIS
jgi:hypothetical protein